MKTTISIICFIVCTIAIPLALSQIIDNNRRMLFIVLLISMIPGYINATLYLHKKYDK